MANIIIHKADSRGHANHGWLETNHTFSFANYYNPERMRFGTLRVLNDDIIQGGMGFGMHPHDNMEIITIPLEGRVRHSDSMGNTGIISAGEIQVMSAGTGILHSEFNDDPLKPLKLLQIWIFPHTRNIEPRYEQKQIYSSDSTNNLHCIIQPESNENGLWINQHAWMHIGRFSSGISFQYQIKDKSNGIYVFVVKGSIKIQDILFTDKDGAGFSDTEVLKVNVISESEILFIEVPFF